MSALAVLNVGAGDLRFRWKDEGDAAQAREVVEDLLRSGYAIVVEDEDGVCRVVEEFDPEFDEYIVAALPAKKRSESYEERSEPTTASARIRKKGSGGGWYEVLVDGKPVEIERGIRKSHATAIAARINGGYSVEDAVEKVLSEIRKPAKKTKATAVAPTAGG